MVNAFHLGNKIKYITSKALLKHIRMTVDVIGKSVLGFSGKDVGTHSIRSSLAMALYLQRKQISTIMLIGRWSSDAFLLYIRRQVQEFSSGVSRAMASQDDFFTIPDIEVSDWLDPRTQNHSSFASTISINGPNASIAHEQRPAIHVWH